MAQHVGCSISMTKPPAHEELLIRAIMREHNPTPPVLGVDVTAMLLSQLRPNFGHRWCLKAILRACQQLNSTRTAHSSSDTPSA